LGDALQEELVSLEEQARPFHALYDHWERTQWSAGAIDFRRDAESFRALSDTQQQAMIWIFAHRFHAEFRVATLLAPFVLAAPTYEMQLVLATQLADEYRHTQCVLRVYEEVFGVRGGVVAAQKVADANTDPVAAYFYEAFEGAVTGLRGDSDQDAFLRAVLAYHLIAEGVVARAAQTLAGNRYGDLGDFPGLREGQRLVARDEARHIGIGVSYVRQRMADDPERTRAVLERGLEEFADLATRGMQMVDADLDNVVRRGYGVAATDFYGGMLRLLDVRLRSIGYQP
jgi:ribonucleotide reductase beta subunit family protein with ferritin-like domain